MSVASVTASDAAVEEILSRSIPGTYRAAFVERDDAARLWDKPEKDVRQTLKVGQVPMPELAPDEALVAVMASAMNYNTVWSARFEPVPTFVFLNHLAKEGGWNERHDQPFHVVGSDAAGVIVAVGDAVRGYEVGDRVVIYPGWSDAERVALCHDGVTGSHSRAWGYETNFGGLGDFAIVKGLQLMPKPRHLSWEEAACNTLCGMTAYRMLVSAHGAPFKQGEIVFIWGAAGGLGSYAVQLVRNGGGIAVGVVSSEEKERAARHLGCDMVIRRDAEDLAELTGKELGKGMRTIVRRELGEDPHVVFEHVGAATFPASVYLARPGGKVVTCGSSTGYEHTFDNRYLWMRAKSIVGSHGSTPQEAREFNRLVDLGMIQPALTRTVGLDQIAEAAYGTEANRFFGKVGVLCQASEEGLGIEDTERRLEVGEDKIEMLRRLV